MRRMVKMDRNELSVFWFIFEVLWAVMLIFSLIIDNLIVRIYSLIPACISIIIAIKMKVEKDG